MVTDALSRLARWVKNGDPFLPVPEQRSFVLGSAVVEPFDRAWGRSHETFTPAEYGDYLATSNPVYACVNLRAKLTASLPLKLYANGNTSKQKEVTEGDERDLLDKVNPRWTRRRLIEMTSMACDLWGVGYWFINKGGRTGTPKELWWARPDMVYVVPDDNDYISGFVVQPANGSRLLTFRPDEVVWFPLANPIDEFAGLAPLAAARLAADTERDAMQSNRNLFVNGLQPGGLVYPISGQPSFTKEQKGEIREALNRGHKGVDNAHRWGVFDREIGTKTDFMTPKDAEFLGLMSWSLESACRAYGVPLDLVGGQRTYANVEASERIIWTQTIRAHASFLASEITEQLLPMFKGAVDLAEFDFSEVDALNESEDAAWARASDQIAKGVITINEWRSEQGLKPLPHGDDWWAPVNLVPIGGAMQTAAEAKAEEAAQLAAEAKAEKDAALAAQNAPGDESGEPMGPRSRRTRTVVYGSQEHERLYQRFVRRTDPWERKVSDVTTDLMRRQKQSILTELRKQDGRAFGQRLTATDLLKSILNLARWIREFRTGIEPVFIAATDDLGAAALDELNVGTSFDVTNPLVRKALEGQRQRFAQSVNQTTWDALKASLGDGLDAGEGIDDLAKRVEQVMGNRIRSSGETIARTEVTAIGTVADREAWRQSGVVTERTWIATFDDRVRDSHAAAHGQTVGLDEDFRVGGSTGPGPGMMSSAEESVSCRCSTIAALDTEAEPRALASNGHALIEIAKLLEI